MARMVRWTTLFVVALIGFKASVLVAEETGALEDGWYVDLVHALDRLVDESVRTFGEREEDGVRVRRVRAAHQGNRRCGWMKVVVFVLMRRWVRMIGALGRTVSCPDGRAIRGHLWAALPTKQGRKTYGFSMGGAMWSHPQV